jgi:hypothetical protein
MSFDTPKVVDARWAEQVTPELLEAVKTHALDPTHITCAVLRKLAEDSGVPYKVAGAAADSLGIKVQNCDLGCF